VFGHLATVQKHLKNIRSRFRENDLIHVDLHVGGLRLILEGEVHLRGLMKQGRLGGVHHLDDLDLKAATPAPARQNREPGLRKWKLCCKEVSEQPVTIHFATGRRDYSFTENKTPQDRFQKQMPS
jgi:hypothetical protein